MKKPDMSVQKRSLRKKSSSQSYSETLMDDFIEGHVGVDPRKKKRTQKDLERETEIEAMIALSLGFPIDSLLDEEIEAGVVNEHGGKEQNDYIVVRNHILAKWRENVRSWLTRGKIRETVSGEYARLISSAHDFLLRNGYINFGVSPPFTAIPTAEENGGGTVIVVGAGLSGLAAARQLLSFGFRVAVLEGRKRPGGRVYTEKMHVNDSDSVSVDLGGSVITGIHANPLVVLARQLSIPLHKIRNGCPLYDPDGAPVDPDVDSRVESVFNKLLDRVTELRTLLGRNRGRDMSLGSAMDTLRVLYSAAGAPAETRLFDWHLANLEYANAGCLSDLSAAHWDQDDPYEMGGDHCFLAGGNRGIVDALCAGIPIFYDRVVDAIEYGDAGARAVSGRQAFEADMVLCTVPLGVLKSRAVTFKPELPRRKREAIARLGFGLLNKVAMVFPRLFWGDEVDTFGCLNRESVRRGEFFLFYSYHTVSGGPVLVALVAGDAAHSFETGDPVATLRRVLDVLRGIYGPKGVEVPDPVQTVCTRWANDPLSRGSYSHVRVGASGDDYDILAESVDDRVFFAGEATNRQQPASMHGAFLSGLREASRIYDAASRRDLLNKRATSKESDVGVLSRLFKNPDTEMGAFSFVFDPTTSVGIMKASFEPNPKGAVADDDGERPSSHLYSLISRADAGRVESVRGGSESRLAFLVNVLGVRFTGGNSDEVISMASRITGARRARRRIHPNGNYAYKEQCISS